MLFIGFFAGTGLLILFLLWRKNVRKKKLGNLLQRIDVTPFRASVLTVSIMRIVIGVAGGILACSFTERPIIARALFLVLFGVVISTEVVTLLTLKDKIGVYENGIIANTGCRLYGEIEYFYETEKEKNLIYLFSFSPKVFVYKQARLYVGVKERSIIRKILMKKIEFDPERKGLRKI